MCLPVINQGRVCMPQVFFCSGCRYRVTAQPEWPVHRVKQALFDGGIGRSNKPEGVRNTPGIQRWQDLVGVSRARGSALNVSVACYMTCTPRRLMLSVPQTIRMLIM